MARRAIHPPFSLSSLAPRKWNVITTGAADVDQLEEPLGSSQPIFTLLGSQLLIHGELHLFGSGGSIVLDGSAVDKTRRPGPDSSVLA